MRNPNRLDNLYETLLAYHKQLFPDLRFFQFIENFQFYIKRRGFDTFYLEDDEIIKYLCDYIEELSGE